MMTTVRFAPSPTGYLHVGNARIALVNWLFARREGGRFLLRLDDTDLERSRDEFARAIEDDLRWLGLVYEGPVRQSQRRALYDAALARLKAEGRLYPCFETPEDLDFRRRRAIAAGRPPIYDRAALRLTEAERAALVAGGRAPHWRFLLDDGEITWDDLVHGPMRFRASDLGDPVLIRSDARPLFTFSSVVDDVDLAITHVFRGDDHISNTAVQIQIFRALGVPPPRFGHFGLLVDAAGRNLSKRDRSLSLAAIREQGIEAMAVNSYLAAIGTSDNIEPAVDLDDLAPRLDLSHFSSTSPRFDARELAVLNARLLHATPYEKIAPRLSALGIAISENIWNAIRGNLSTLADVAVWRDVILGDIPPVLEDAAFCRAAAALLPPPPWDGATWKVWTRAVTDETGRKGKDLFHPLRLALTGRADGPELGNLLPLIGPERARTRLLGAAV